MKLMMMMMMMMMRIMLKIINPHLCRRNTQREELPTCKNKSSCGVTYLVCPTMLYCMKYILPIPIVFLFHKYLHKVFQDYKYLPHDLNSFNFEHICPTLFLTKQARKLQDAQAEKIAKKFVKIIKITKNCPKSPNFANSCQKGSKVILDCQKLATNSAESYQKLPTAAKSCQQWAS